MRVVPIRIAVCAYLIAAAVRAAVASNVAFDTAGDSAYNNGWTQGSNGGYGWGGGWSFQTSDSSSPATEQVVPDTAFGGILNSPAAPDGRAWALTNAVATRRFASALSFGQTFTVEMDGGTSGIQIAFADPQSDTDYFYITSVGGRDYILSESYGYRGGPSFQDTGVLAINGPVVISLTESEMLGDVFQIQSLALPNVTASIHAGFPPVAAGEVEMAGSGSAALYMNNMTITPEPSAICLAGAAAIGLLRRRRPRVGRG